MPPSLIRFPQIYFPYPYKGRSPPGAYFRDTPQVIYISDASPQSNKLTIDEH